jgi:arylsulfatase A-like enzyme
MNMPHYPYQGEPKWLERYGSLKPPRNLYAAFVSTLDERVGRLIAKLDSLGLRDKTILIYQSDHGHSTELRAFNGGGSAGPYRGAKFSMFEGGLRVPAIISWPGQIAAGEVRGQFAHGCDWMPTIAELCGVKLLNPDIDGLSLVPVLKSSSAQSPHETTHWQTGTGNNARWAVRRGDWKLIGNPQDTGNTGLPAPKGPLFLSDLAGDVGETQDHAAEHPEIVADLLKRRADWLQAIGK